MKSIHLLVTLLVLAITATAGAQVSDKVLLKDGRIIPVVGDEIAKGSILIENGKITAIGADVKAPYDAKVVDCTGKVLFPGMVEGMTGQPFESTQQNDSIDVSCFLHAADAIDPSKRYFEEALRAGILSVHACQGNNTVISAVSRVVRPIGMTVSEMTVRADGGVKISFAPKRGYDRSAQMAVLRETFAELDRYLEGLAEKLYEEDLEKKGEELKVGPDEAAKKGKDLITLARIDDRHRNLVRLRKGRLDVFAWCAAPMDIRPALAVAEKEGFKGRMALMLGADCHRAVAELKRAAKELRPFMLPTSSMVHTKRDRITGEDVQTFVPKVLSDAGLAFAIVGTMEPWYEAARCVRNGVPRNDALAAITINAAKAIGMGHRLGSLEVGKDGNVLVLTGDPLDVATWVEGAFIEGRHVYERSKDLRLRKLLEGVEMTAEEKRRAEKKKADAEKKKADAKKKDDAKKPAPKKPGDAKEAPKKAGDAKKTGDAKKPGGAPKKKGSE